jgi:hypothetical protein
LALVHMFTMSVAGASVPMLLNGSHQACQAKVGLAMKFFIKRRVENEAEPLSPREFERILERRTRYYFDMSVPEFRQAFSSGKLDENLAATDIALLLGEATR